MAYSAKREQVVQPEVTPAREKRDQEWYAQHPGHPAARMMELQQTLGNQAAQRMIQPKLAVSQPGDAYEREADQVAEAVTAAHEPQAPRVQQTVELPSSNMVQRKCMECEEEEKRAPIVQRKVNSSVPPESAPNVNSPISDLQGSGQPLSPAVRSYFEPRLDYDFGQVRVHTDVSAAESARRVNALAYTVGRDIVFNSGQFAPETAKGKHLLAHELVHVIQQSGGSHAATHMQAREVDSERVGISASPGLKKPLSTTPAPYHVARQPAEGQMAQPNCEQEKEGGVVRIKCDRRTLVNLSARSLGNAVSLKEERGPGYIRFTYKSRNRPHETWLPRPREVWGGFQPGTRPPTTLSGDKILVQPTTVDQDWSVTISRPGVSAPSPSPERFPEAPSGTVAVAQSESNRNTTLDAALEQIRKIPIVLTAENKALKVAEALVGIDLNDPKNLSSVINTIAQSFGPDSTRVLSLFLTALERTIRAQQPPGTSVPTPQEAARLQSQIGLLQVQPRDPYGRGGYGVLLPVLSQPARPLLPLAYAFQGAGGFVEGLMEGLKSSLSEDQLKQLSTKLQESALLSQAFSSIFAAGAAVGIVEDVIDTIKEIFHTLANLAEVVNGFIDLIQALFSPESRDVANAFGREIGQDYGKKIVELLQGNIFEFTFNLGRLIGPTIVYTVLAFLGVPELIAAAIVERLLPILRVLLQRFPRLLRIVEAVAARLIRTGKFTTTESLEADLERSFGRTFTEPAPVPRPAGSGILTQAPETAAGFLAQYLQGFRRLLGKPFTSNEVADLARVWSAAANPGESATLTLANSRNLFNNHRGRFWRRVRQDPAARQLFLDAGCVFEGRETTAPFYRLPNGSKLEMTIDHIVERQTNPGLALDPANLQIVSRRENVVSLRQIHAQDPFQ